MMGSNTIACVELASIQANQTTTQTTTKKNLNGSVSKQEVVGTLALSGVSGTN